MIYNASKKFIGINQHVPITVLDHALASFLETGEIDRKEIALELSRITKGGNRSEKASRYACQILTKPMSVLDILKKNINSSQYVKLHPNEKKAIILSLLSITYPITYDLLVTVATVLKVQPQVSKAYINQKMGSIYGSNRTLAVALDALMPMLIELNTIERVKIGLYKRGPVMRLSNPMVTELYIYTEILLSGSKSIIYDDIKQRPWFYFFEVDYKKDIHKKFLKYSEGRLGGGYISI